MIRTDIRFTLGTGVGSALFTDGHLVSNLELTNQLFGKGQTYDEQLGSGALKKVGKRRWNTRLCKAIRSLEKVYNYDVLSLGVGESKHIIPRLPAALLCGKNGRSRIDHPVPESTRPGRL